MKLGLSLGVFAAGLLVPVIASAQGQPPMQSGGLAPPSGAAPPPPPQETETQRDLEEAEEEDSGKGLEFFWLNAEAGFANYNLQSLSSDQLVPQGVKTKASGGVFGVGVGVRIIFITLGGRFRISPLDIGDLWTVDGELGIRIPLGRVEPYLTLGGGYAALGSFDSSNLSSNVSMQSSNLEITGGNVRAGFGFDWYVTNVFSLGANLTGDFLFMTRPEAIQIAQGMQPQTQEEAVLAVDGTSVGTSVAITGVLGLHF